MHITGNQRGMLLQGIPLFLALVVVLANSLSVSAQSALVRWPNTGFNPTINNANITSANISTSGGVTIQHQDWGNTNNFFQFENWHLGGQDNNSYIEFVVTPNSGNLINFSTFTFTYRVGWGENPKYQIRISKDNFATYQTVVANATASTNWTDVSVNISALNPVYSGQTFRIRIYVYANHGVEFHLKRMMNANAQNNFSETTTINGTVVATSVPIVVNDNASTLINSPVDINILSNDTFTNLSQINITQNPSNGSVVVNGTTNVKYIPNNGYTGSDQFKYTLTDQYGTSAEATVNVTVDGVNPNDMANLVLNVSPSSLTPIAGQNVTFSVNISNLGPANATSTLVSNLLPSGYMYVSSSPTKGTFNSGTGVWNIGNLAISEQETLLLTAKVLSSGNHAFTTYASMTEADNTPSNNSVYLDIVPIIPNIDLGVTMSANKNAPIVGENLTYTIIVTNHGATTAYDVEVLDVLPTGFSYVSSSATAGAYNASNGKWTIGNLAAGTSRTLNIVAQRLATGNFTNTASVSHSGTDPNASNNSSSVAMAFGCEPCTHVISGAAITVNAGQVYCLESGSWAGGVNMNGGTICISPGATFNANYINGTLDGKIVNNGTVTNFPIQSAANKNLVIINMGTFSGPYIQSFSGEIQNYGTITITGTGQIATLTGSVLKNYGQITTPGISFTGTSVTNYESATFTILGTASVASGYWENKLGGNILFETTGNTNANFTGDIDNLGFWKFGKLSGLSSTLNNYGEMEIYNAANNISSTTYLTNDGLLEFININDVQYNGPMLTNNGTITISAEGAGHFKMNQAINQVYNNGLISITGEFQQNAAGNKLENNCTISAKNFFVGNGRATNNGLINVFGTGVTAGRPDGLNIEGSDSFFINGKTGFVQAVNFRNSGHISGYGSYYFTGTTNNQSSGTFIGDSSTEQILFFDATPPASGIFDLPGATTSNVLRPDSMSPQDLSTFDCVAPPTYAGAPPVTNPMSISVCDPEELTTISFDVLDYATPADPVNGDPFVLLMNSIRLFEFDNLSNPSNNTTSLTIAGKGTLSVDGNGLLTFEPDPSFTSGIFEAEYRISNKRAGDVVTYPSPRTKITIKAIYINLQAITSPGDATEVCVGGYLALSNAVEGGEWISSNPGVATINEDGLVTGISAGSTTITYIKTEEDCVDSVQIVLTIKNCETPSSKLISNPMIRQRVGGGN